MQKKVFIKTFGCQMNEYDSDKMADVLHVAEGLVKTDRPEEADVILLNTCSIREKAQEKVFSDLGRLRALKKDKPDLLIGVGGCVASQEGDAIIKRAPFVDMVFGPQTLHRLPQMISERRYSGRPQVDISFPEIEKFDHLPPARVEGATAYVSIMEGCSKYCSYCVVPYTRGEEVSRRFEDVLTEVAGLADQGVKEIMLLGQNVNAYRGVMEDGEIADFALLIEYIAELPGIERIRFVTSHPKEFSQRLIDTYAKVPKLCNHLYLPAQHGSDRTLAAMKRGYTALEYKSVIRRMRKVRPDITVQSDFIVGFPGETEEDFEALMKLVADVGFDNSFSFIFSPRPGTPAASLADDTPQEVKLARLQRLQAALNENAAKISAAQVGTVQKVLVEGISKRREHELQGRTESNRVVNFDGGPNGQRLIGEIIEVRVTEAFPFSLRGEIVTRHWWFNPLNRNRALKKIPNQPHHFTPQPLDNKRLANLCGALDENLRQISAALDVTIFRRGDRFVVTGTNAERAVEVLERFYEKADRPVAVDDIQLALVEQRANAAADEEAGLPPLPARRGKAAAAPAAPAADDKDSQDPLPESPILKTRKHDLRGRTPHQSQYLNAILEHDITFGVGPAGTGKTYLAVACAVDALERDAVQRIVLTRPAVEAGERLGFLPGDLAQKVDPYLRPLYDALYDLLGFDRTQKLFEKQAIEIAPLAYMRGRTLNHAFIILDEAQNTTPEQMKMFLTRIGFGSKAVITGDVTQVDLHHGQKSGLVDALSVLHDVRGIAFSRFTSADVVRHPLVARIVDAYDAAGNPRPDTARATARTATNLLTKSAKPRHAKT